MNHQAKILSLLVVAVLFCSCDLTNQNREEELPTFKINNASSFDLIEARIQILAFNNLNDFVEGNIDTTSYLIPNLRAESFTENFEIPKNSVSVVIQYFSDGDERNLSSSFDVFDVEDDNSDTQNIEYKKLSGSYTLRLFDKYVYTYEAFSKDSAATDSAWVRVVNKTNAPINDFELRLDQERPTDPDDAASRAQIDVKSYNLGNLGQNDFSNYVSTDLLFDEPRSFYFEARGQEASVVNYNFEKYFYSGKEELGVGYYTLQVLDDYFFLISERKIKSDSENVEN